MNPADLVGLAELAKRAGTRPGVVQSWRRRHADFPAPVLELAMGPVWDWNDVVPWIVRQRLTSRGRPRRSA